MFYLLFIQTVPPMFVQPTDSIINSAADTRIVLLSDMNLSTEYCSDLQGRNISVACRAVGIPEPQVDVLVDGNVTEPVEQASNQVVIRLSPIPYGEAVIFECQASTDTTTLNITVNFTYTCKLVWLYKVFNLSVFALDIVPTAVCVIAKQKPTMQKENIKVVTGEKHKLTTFVYNCSKH